jgi:hypothetical protein
MRAIGIAILLLVAPLARAQCSVATGQSVICASPFLNITIPNLTVQSGIAYSSGNLVAVGASGAVTWMLVSGANPQSGLTLSVGSTASIAGTPTTGTCTWTVKWTDSVGNTFTGPVSVNIASLTGVVVSPTTANVNKSTTFQFTASAVYGIGPPATITSLATWTLPSGTGCTGSTVNSTGLFTAGTTAGACTVQAAFGSPSQNGQATATVTGTTGGLTIQSTDPLPNGQINQLYSSAAAGVNGSKGPGQGVQMTATGGTAPYTWNVQTGTLPTGLSMSSSGLITGTTTASGAGIAFTLRVTDAASATQTFNGTSGITVASLTSQAQNLGATTIPGGTSTSVGVTGTYSDMTTAAIPTAPGGGGATPVQTTQSSFSNSAHTTFPVTFTNATGAGHAYIAYVLSFGVTPTSVATSQSDTCATAVAISGSGIFYCLNVAGGATTTITATFPSTSFGGMYIHEVSGILTSAAFDQSHSGTGTSTSVSSGSITTTAANEYIVGTCDGDYNITAGTSGWTTLSNSFGDWFQSLAASATGTYTSTCTMQTSGNWRGLIASFKSVTPPAGQATITSSNLACATVSTAPPIQVNALNVASNCTSTITSTVTGIANATATLAVTAATQDISIIIVPNPSYTLQDGQTLALQAIGNVTSQPYNVNWAISPNNNNATVNPLTGTQSVFTCTSNGHVSSPYTVNASFAGLTGGSTLISCVSPGSGGTINLANCTQTELANKWATMTSGPYIIVFPSCNVSWTAQSSLTIPGGVTSVTIQGNTTVTCTGTAGTSSYNCATVDNTAISDGFLSTSPLLLLNIGSGSFRMTGMTFQGGAATAPKNPAVFQISGIANPSNFRIDHSHLRVDNYTSSTYMDFMRVFGIYGVIDHTVFNLTGTANAVDFFNGAVSDNYGDTVWSQVTGLGGPNFLFLENNVFTGGMISDCAWGGRGVVRYNSSISQGLYSSSVHSHGTSDRLGRWRGCRANEAYHNYITSSGANAWLGTGGGVLVAWGNTLAAGYNHLFGGSAPRSDGSEPPYNNPPAGWGYCGTTLNSNGVGSAWDGNSIITTGYPCMDGIGRGMGDLINGQNFPNALNTATGTRSWTRQQHEPSYLFMNTISVGNLGYLGESVTQWNRDVYGDCGSAGSTSGCGSAFNGTAGTGFGTLASRPATCTAGTGGTYQISPTGSYGVAYWATDQNILYVCTTTNTWTNVYTPYVYPHPLDTGP